MTQEEKQLEVWKPIPNYEEYEVSNFGRVKRLAYDKPVCGGSVQFGDTLYNKECMKLNRI